MNKVLSIHLVAKKPRQSSSKPENITFTKEDLAQVQHPNNNPLFIQLRINGNDVKQIPVDSNNSVEVMYYDLYKYLKRTKDDLMLFKLC